MKRIGWAAVVGAAAICAVPAAATASGGGHGDGPNILHRMMLLAIQLGVILFAAKLFGIFAEKVGIPAVLGELTAGIVIGPFALGQVPFYGFPEGLFPMFQAAVLEHGHQVAAAVPIWPELSALAAIAAIVLLFDVGLETDLKLLIRYSFAGGVVGLGGVLFAFVLGDLTLMAFSDMMFGRSLGFFSPECLFAGTVSTATSVGITARILSERNKLDSPEGVTILSAAVIDDVIGIIILAVVMGMVSAGKSEGGVDWGHIGIVAAKAVGVWLLGTVLGLLASRHISGLLKWFGDRNAIAIMALGLALVLAGLFEEAGLAMIIGAYVMGLSLSRADIAHVVREKLHVIYAFLVPVFFCVTGMQINLGALTSRPVLVFGAIYTVVAFVAKVVGCGLPSMLAGFNLRGAARVGFGMMPRGEVGLIVAGIGLGAGFLNDQLFASTILMVFINTVLAPPVLVRLFSSSASGLRKPPPDGESAETNISYSLPSTAMAEFFVEKVGSVLEQEGFFVHRLGHEGDIYQARKETIILNYSHVETEIKFDCELRDVPLIKTAVGEALAALESAVRELRKPLDARAVRTEAEGSSQANLTTRSFSLRDYFLPNLVRAKLAGGTKGEVIDEMLAMLVDAGLVKDAEDARNALLERERSMSTGLEDGVAIPHGKTDAVDGLVCAVGLKHAGIDFDAFDGKPSRIFILTLSPKSKPAPHVQLMSTVSHLLGAGGRQRLLACETDAQLHQALSLPGVAGPPSRRPRIRRGPGGGKFRLADYLRPDLLTTSLTGATKEQAIGELIDLLEGRGLLADRAEAERVVLQREEEMPTGMGSGVAIPHGRTDVVSDLVCAIGVKADGLDFGALDGLATQIVVLVLTPLSGADPYVQFVAAVISALEGDRRDKMVEARTPQEMFDALTAER